MHKTGVNLRYIGLVVKEFQKTMKDKYVVLFSISPFIYLFFSNFFFFFLQEPKVGFICCWDFVD